MNHTASIALGQKKYFAKLLLFGEYTVLNGGKALAIPIKNWHGCWGSSTGVDSRLVGLYDYLRENNCADYLRLEEFKRHIDEGLVFTSTIPEGYGVGSSAALSAAIYDTYGYGHQSDAQVAMDHLSVIEGHFHGKSSGLDPLPAYYNMPVLRNDTKVELVQNMAEVPANMFLINSGLKRSTANLVDIFSQKMEETHFTDNVLPSLLDAVDSAIVAFLDADLEDFWKNLKVISKIQLVHFPEMIPDAIRTVWSEIAELPGTRLKLCGAGGGGFFLGFNQGELDSDFSASEDIQFVVLQENSKS